MKILVLTDSLSSLGGGVFFAITRLYRIIDRDVASFRVLGYEDQKFDEDSHQWGRLDVRAYQRGPFGLNDLVAVVFNFFRFSPRLTHYHGFWSIKLFVIALCCRLTGRPIVISPHGMLDEWALRKRKKLKLIYCLVLRVLLGKKVVFHALNIHEKRSISKLKFNRSICIIGNGVPFQPPRDYKSKDFSLSFIFLSRIHPKKGVEELIKGFSNYIKKTRRTDILKVYGWGDEVYISYLKSLIESIGMKGFVEIFPPVFGEKKREVFSSANAFLLPSYSEGLPMAVLEAWSYSVPVLMSRFCNLNDAFDADSALEVDPDVDSIAACLEKFSVDGDLQVKLSKNGYSYCAKHYDEKLISKNYIDLYKSLGIHSN